MILRIKAVALSNPNGFTVELPTLEHVRHGIVVAYLETQGSHDDEGLKKCIEHATGNSNVIGGWYDDDENLYYYDSCKVFDDFDEALIFGKANKQIAIFDLDRKKPIRL